ncbi:MAG: hypothetical protein WA981_14540 [Glaciecola sp.]
MKCLSSMMKLMTTMTLVVSISGFNHAHSVVSEEVGYQELRGKSGLDALNSLSSLNEKMVPTIKTLANTICSHFVGDATKVAKNIKKTIKSYMKEQENINNPSPEQMIKFLNRNKNHMLCGNTNYMVESFRHGAYDELFNVLFFEKLLVEDESLYVDINAISFTGPPTGKEPETTLDYMYREVKRKGRSQKSRGEIQYLIEMFEEYFNGKRFSELTDAEKAAAARYGN